MAKYLVEFIGTFFLVATIGFTVLKPGDAGRWRSGNWIGVDGHGLCGRSYLGRAFIIRAVDPGGLLRKVPHLATWCHIGLPIVRSLCSGRDRALYEGHADGGCNISRRREGSGLNSCSPLPFVMWY